ncbi:MAG: hypothetical protein HEP71_01665 [Roseivirga sp.]|nr:hypothetical protein [Roseivirga sp.]
MQIIDANDYNLRTAVYLFERGKLEFLVIPMLHIGSKEFYQEVSQELEKCDFIIYEGVGLKKLVSVWSSYRRFAKRLGLRYQNDELVMKKFQHKLIHADYAGKAAEDAWKKIPLTGRLLFRFSLIIGLTFLSFKENKRSFAKTFRKNEGTDDQLWFMKIGKSNSVHNFIMEKRNNIIMEKIDEQLQNERKDDVRIGVIYGAAHMPGIIHHLMNKHKFTIKDSWFLTVLWLSKQNFRFKRKEDN